MSNFTYYHNPKCSTSVKGLKLLNDNGGSINVVDYIKNPVSSDEIEHICEKLGQAPLDIVRKKDADKLGLTLSDKNRDQLCQLIAQHPKILQRPILVGKTKAVVGRPVEELLTLLSD